jgi:hypothetical protein
MARGWLHGKLKGILRKQEEYTGGSLMSTHNRMRPAEGEVPSWAHLLVLGGVSHSFFSFFKVELDEAIKNSEVVTPENIHRIAGEALKPLNTTRAFSRIRDDRSELSQMWKAANFARDPKEFIEEALNARSALEFYYETSNEESMSIRQVTLLKAYETYFQAKSHLGIRNYSYEKVRWVSFPAERANTFDPPYAIHIVMDNANFKTEGSKLRLIYGVMVNGGLELNIPATRHLEDEEVSLFYSMKK